MQHRGRLAGEGVAVSRAVGAGPLPHVRGTNHQHRPFGLHRFERAGQCVEVLRYLATCEAVEHVAAVLETETTQGARIAAERSHQSGEGLVNIQPGAETCYRPGNAGFHESAPAAVPPRT